MFYLFKYIFFNHIHFTSQNANKFANSKENFFNAILIFFQIIYLNQNEKINNNNKKFLKITKLEIIKFHI